jgi:hypothetical protein
MLHFTLLDECKAFVIFFPFFFFFFFFLNIFFKNTFWGYQICVFILACLSLLDWPETSL